MGLYNCEHNFVTCINIIENVLTGFLGQAAWTSFLGSTKVPSPDSKPSSCKGRQMPTWLPQYLPAVTILSSLVLPECHQKKIDWLPFHNVSPKFYQSGPCSSPWIDTHSSQCSIPWGSDPTRPWSLGEKQISVPATSKNPGPRGLRVPTESRQSQPPRSEHCSLIIPDLRWGLEMSSKSITLATAKWW
jgi:hypothetical protein